MSKPIYIDDPSSFPYYLSPKAHDLTNQPINFVIVKKPVAYPKQGQYWACLCDCGQYFLTSSGSLTANDIKSCGCKRTEVFIGQEFGWLTVKRRLPYKKYGKNIFWECECTICGTRTEVPTCHLTSGYSTSCGCRYHYPNLQGKPFGKLLVIALSKKQTKSRERLWKCRCECGNITYVTTNKLIKGKIRSCKDNCSNILDLTGKPFGYLKVLGLAKKERKASGKHRIFWTCRCTVCGTITTKNGEDLRSGHTKSCGCQHWKSGEDNANWNPFLTQDAREQRQQITPEDRAWSRHVRLRDNCLCALCGRKSNSVAHHLDDPALFPDRQHLPENGVTLCRSCHTLYHNIIRPVLSTRVVWQDFLRCFEHCLGQGTNTKQRIKHTLQQDYQGCFPAQRSLAQA